MIVRNKTIDVAKGIAILLVILGHSFYSLNEPINKIILTFHMPLFFVLSGMVAKTADQVGNDERGYIRNKMRIFFVPQITLGMLSFIYYGAFTVVMKHRSLQEVGFIYQFWRYWFLQVMFIVVILFYFLSKYIKFSRRNQMILLGSCLMLGIFFSYFMDFPDESPMYLNVVPMALFFFFLGYVVRKTLTVQWEEKFKENRNKYAVLLVAGTVCCLSALGNKNVTMYNNNYGNFLLFASGSISGILAVWCLADILKENRFLRWCGLNSIVIYVWQFVLTQFFKNVVEMVRDKFYGNVPNIVMTVFVFLLCIIAIIPIVLLSNLYIPEIYGKKRKKIILSDNRNK